jgi:hypothetical protein
MVYKRYIKKKVNGKFVNFGPYYYESYRDKDGKVKTRYISGPETSSGKSNVTNKKISNSFFLIPLAIVILFAGILILNQPSFSQKINSFGHNIFSSMTGFALDEGAVESSGESSVSDGSGTTSDSGGVSESSGSTSSSETPSVDSSSSAIPSESVSTSSDPIIETPPSEITSDSSSQETVPEETSASINPEVIITESASNQENNIPAENETSSENPATENVAGNESVQEETLSEQNSTQIISEETNQTISNQTFSEAEISNNTFPEELNPISFENETLIGNITLANITLIENIIFINETLVENITFVNETIITNLTSNVTLEISTKHYNIRLGKPVRWEKKINVNSSEGKIDNLTLELPSLAGNISVKKTNKETNEETDLNVNVQNEKEIHETEPIIEEKENSKSVVKNIFNFFLSIAGRMTGRVVDESAIIEPNVSVEIAEEILNEDEIIVEYYTEPPYSAEKIIGESKKEITIVGPDEVHYEDVLAFTELPFNSTAEMVKLYWINNESKSETEFVSYDDNLDGFVDYIEWVVPHLSNQSYELEIVILNVQSYPTVGGNWTVAFNTTGSADLTITAFNGTTWGIGNESIGRDLEFLELRCGETILNSTIIIDGVEIPYDIYQKKKRIEEIRGIL